MSDKNTRVLILGGEGFIGRNIADLLSLKCRCFSGDLQKSIFEKRRDKFLKINPYIEKIKDKYDIIIHLIDNKKGMGLFESEELEFIKNIGLNKDQHMILFSSAAVYASPDSDYGKRKIKLEKIYQDYCNNKGIKLTIFRLFNIYGPYQLPNRPGSLVANIFYNHINKRPTEINDMEIRRDFIYAQDMAKFVEYVIEKSFTGITDLATNKLVSIRELLGFIEEVLGEKLLVEDKKNKENAACPVAKNQLVSEIELMPLIVGLKKTRDFYKKNTSVIKKHNK